MPWTVYAIFGVFGLFVVLMITNPKLSCFGRKISSPLYPLTRKRKQKEIKTEDYGFSLTGSGMKEKNAGPTKEHESGVPQDTRQKDAKKIVKTHDYGFHLDGAEDLDK